MRIDVHKQEDTVSNLGSNGGILTGPLYLANDPVNNLELTTKQYVDTTINNHAIDNTHFTPEQKELVSNINVTAMEINSTIGLIDNLNTQLNNTLSIDGGTLTGYLTLHAFPVAMEGIATKQYVDNDLGINNDILIGDVVRKPYSTAPSGFLRCNGAYVSKTTYSALFAVIGNTFDLGINLDYTAYHSIGAGQPYRQQYNTNAEQITDITGWTIGNSLPEPLRGSQAIVTKNRVYLLGGINDLGSSNKVYTAPINIDGVIGTWSQETSLPISLHGSQTIVTKNKVYLLGGNNGINNISTIYYANINIDGTLGVWSIDSNTLPGPLSYSQAIVTKDRVYLLGGNNGSHVDTVFSTSINLDGFLGVWTNGTTLPGTLDDSQVVVTKNRVYLLGGSSAGVAITTVYTAIINADGTLGIWTIDTPLPLAIRTAQVIVTKGSIYLLGGNNGTSNITTVYTAPINVDGTIGVWTVGTSIPETLGDSQTIVTKNRVYLLGGFNGANNISTVYTSSILGGENDLSLYYNGSLNKFDGTDPVGTTNPDNATLFMLPDTTEYDLNISKTHSYIKY